MIRKSSAVKKTFRLFIIKFLAIVLMLLSIISLASTVIHAQATNPWNIQRNTTTNDLDFYLNSNGLSGASLQLKSNGSARIRSLYDLGDDSNTYLLDPNGNSRLKNATIDTLNQLAVTLYNKDAIQGSDTWLRLNQSGQFTSGTHTPGLFAPMSLNVGGVGGWANPGNGNAYIAGNLRIDAYNPLNFGSTTPNGTFRLTPNVHINTPTNYGVIVNWDNGSTGDLSVGQFTVGNGNGGALFNVRRDGGTFVGASLWGANYLGYPGYLNVYGQVQALRYYDDNNGYYMDLNVQSEINGLNANYYHTRPNDSWFPYPGNNWNYFRGFTMAFTAPWYDENDPSTYVDPSNFSKFNQLGFNTVTCIGNYCPQYGLLRVTPNIHLNTPSNTGLYVNWDNGVTTAPNTVYPFNVGNGNGGHLFYVRGDGYVWTIGQFAAANVWYSSDERLKKDISPISDPLSKLLNLRGVTYKYDKQRYPEKTSILSDTQQVGFVAQEVEKIVPEVVTTDNDGFKSVSYGNITALVVEGIKEQENHINSLQQEFTAFKITSNGELESMKKELNTQKEINNKQEQEINELRDEIELLKQQVQQLKGR